MERFKKLVADGLQSQAAQTPSAMHPDAEVLSAFAEQALSDSERTLVLQHLGSCRECRDVLYLAAPQASEQQRVVAVPHRRGPSFALRWGTLAATIAIAAILIVTTRERSGTNSLTPQQVSKSASMPAASADLKTPPEVAEMHALRDDRPAVPKKSLTSEEDKLVPTPKRMTARPAAKFDIDDSGQVRMAPRPAVAGPSPAKNLDDSSVTASSKQGPVGGVALSDSGSGFGVVSGQLQNSVAVPGQIGGTVTDQSGAVIANATITMIGAGNTRAVQTDTRGQFLFDRLTPGSYSVMAQARGFQTAELQRVAVPANKPSSLQVQLQPGNTSQTVAVTAQTAQAFTTSETAPISQAQVEVETTAEPRSKSKKVRQGNQLSAKNEAELQKSTAVAGSPGSNEAPPLARWTLSPNGDVQRSLDLGKDWQPVAVGGDGPFHALAAVGHDVWVGGAAGALYHSSDSGKTWTRVILAASGRKLHADITHVDFADALNGVVTAADGEVWTTSDSGQSWNVK